MKVLVWMSNGNVDVYAADTPEQVRACVELIIEVIEKHWHLENVIERVTAHMDKNPNDRKAMVLAFNTLRQHINPGMSNDDFEILEFSEVKEA